MLVIVAVGQIDLANAGARLIALHFRQDADLESPVRRNAQFGYQGAAEGEFAGKQIAESPHEGQIFIRAENAFERHQQRPDKQPVDPAVHLAVGDPRVISLAEFKAEIRIGHRVEKAGQKAAVIGQHVAIMEAHRVGLAAGIHHADAVPDIAALAGLGRPEALVLELVLYGFQARAVIPQH